MSTDPPSTGPGKSTGTDPYDVEPCPSCFGTSEVTVLPATSPKVRGWSCAGCRTEWWVSVVNPRPPRPPRLFVEYLAASAELTAARLALHEIITLADHAPGMTDTELRTRVRSLADVAARGSR